MKIRNIWNTYNVSTLLVLPIYSDICKIKNYRKDQSLILPFIQICLESGLINTFLTDTFSMMFKSDVIEKNKLIIKNSSYSFSEILISSSRFINIKFANDKYIVYDFKLPEKYLKDINLIKESKYSQVSAEYKSELLVTQNRIPLLKTELSNVITKYNIPYSIVTKSKHLESELREVFNIEKITSEEMYINFDPDLETFKENYDY